MGLKRSWNLLGVCELIGFDFDPPKIISTTGDDLFEFIYVIVNLDDDHSDICGMWTSIMNGLYQRILQCAVCPFLTPRYGLLS